MGGGRGPAGVLDGEARPLQRRVVVVLSAAQVSSGLGTGVSLTLSALLIVKLTGSSALAGLPVTALSVVAALAAQPLAGLALRRGRRVALSTGLLLATVGAFGMLLAPVWHSVAVLLVGSALMGFALVVQLQARFAATDLSEPATRARDLGLVLWAITPGAVAGPNLVAPGAALGVAVGLPPLSGPFLFAIGGLLSAALVLLVGLRPDPLLTAQRVRGADAGSGRSGSSSITVGWDAVRRSPRAGLAVATIGAAHLTMVGVMTGTPVHLTMLAGGAMAGEAGVLTVIGFTISVHLAGMYALSPVVGWLADRVGRTRVVVGALGLLATAMLVAGLGEGSTPAVTVGLLLLGLGWSASVVAGSALLAESVPTERRIAAQGLTDALMGVTATLGAAASGPALAYLGFTALNLAALSFIVGTSVWGILVLRRSLPHDPPPAADHHASSG